MRNSDLINFLLILMAFISVKSECRSLYETHLDEYGWPNLSDEYKDYIERINTKQKQEALDKFDAK